MENASQALEISGYMLIFMLAVSLAIISFSSVRETADAIITQKDRETVYIDGDFYYEDSPDNFTRNVGLETIIPAIYRSYLEKYKVVIIDKNDSNFYLYKIKSTNTKKNTLGSDAIEIKVDLAETIDNNLLVLGNSEDRNMFLNKLLYNDIAVNTSQKDYEINTAISSNGGLSKYLENMLKSGRTIKEELGVYYTDESDSKADVMKTEKRIITYTIQ